VVDERSEGTDEVDVPITREATVAVRKSAAIATR
jgi:hypothetical protein